MPTQRCKKKSGGARQRVGKRASPLAPLFICFSLPLGLPYANWASQECCRRGRWHPTPVLLPGKSHGRRGLVGCSPWGREESDMTERLHFHFSLSGIGEGNGNPLSVLAWRIPGTGGAWWAAVYGVAQSWTQLKRLSSSSSSRSAVCSI